MQEIENHEKEMLIIDIVKANIYAGLMLIPILIVFGMPYYMLWGADIDLKVIVDSISPKLLFSNGGIYFGVAMLGIVAHELIHGLTWLPFTKHGFKSIKFGILWKMLTPYCHCKEAMKVKHYILGAITPAIFLGFIPALVAIAIGNTGLLVFGMFFIMAGGGDFMIIHLLRNENKNDLVQDHPSEAGCYIYRRV